MENSNQENTKIIRVESDSVQILPSVKRVDEFMRFVNWFAAPSQDREPKNQKEFTNLVGVCEDTISDWKNHPCFNRLLLAAMGERVRDQLPEIINGLCAKVSEKGGIGEAELLFRLAGLDVSKPKKKKE